MRRNFNYIKAFLTDYLFWLYLSASTAYLFFKLGEINLPLTEVFLVPIALTGLFILLKDSLGVKAFLPHLLPDKPWFKQFWGLFVVIGLIITFTIGSLIVEINPVKFFSKFHNASNIVSGLLNPDFTILIPMLKALVETIFLALMATIIAIPFAFVLSFFAARNLMPHTFIGNSVYYLIRTIATIFRSIEAIVWAIIFCVWVGIGPFAGTLALMIHSIAALIKLYSEQIENIDKGPIEAIKSTGASQLQIWVYAVIPQIMSPFLAFTIYRWDINVRMATIVGFVGGGGIGLALQQQQQLLQWRSVGLIMWLIALTVWIMDIVSGKVRQNMMDV